MQQFFHTDIPFKLESGEVLPAVTIAYHTWGRLNKNRDNVIWICHALTANSNVEDWWTGMIGEGSVFNSNEYFVVCANILGSCYGSTGPISNDQNGNPYYHQFPFITIRDMVQAHERLRQHLNINQIFLLAGGSMGGYQVIEWSIMNAAQIQNLCLIATGAKESAWGIAIHTAQRMAIETDSTWKEHHLQAGEKGLAVARAIGMLTYRNYKLFVDTQSEDTDDKVDSFKASSYIMYHGSKLIKRFNAYSYWILTRAMDAHNIARNRGDIRQVLNSIQQPALIIGIESDILCPVAEQEFLADHIPSTKLKVINSRYGHDGFLVETKQISDVIKHWLFAKDEMEKQ